MKASCQTQDVEEVEEQTISNKDVAIDSSSIRYNSDHNENITPGIYEETVAPQIKTGFHGLSKIDSVESVIKKQTQYTCNATITGYGRRSFIKICSIHEWPLIPKLGLEICKKCGDLPNRCDYLVVVKIAIQDDDLGVFTYLKIPDVLNVINKRADSIMLLVKDGHCIDKIVADELLGISAKFVIDVDTTFDSLHYKIESVERIDLEIRKDLQLSCII